MIFAKMTTLLQHRLLFQPYLPARELTVEEGSGIKMREMVEKKDLWKKIKKKQERGWEGDTHMETPAAVKAKIFSCSLRLTDIKKMV